MARIRTTPILAEAVAVVPILRAGAGRHLALDGLRRRVHLLLSLVNVVAVRL